VSAGAARLGPVRFGRGARRRLWFGLLTLLGLAPRGFFIPYRYAGALPRAGRRPPYPAVEARFAAREEHFHAALGWIDAYADELERIGAAPEPAPAPRWSQDWFPRLDAAAAYALARRRAPRRIVEVGSGHSTRFLARAVADGGLATAITAIDPAPRADLAGLPVDLLRMTVQEAGLAPFAALEAGDMLLVDSSHVLMPGSDVDVLFGRVLPGLPAGVAVQIHDTFLPDDYPAAWDWRGYNEQLGLLPLLLGGSWEVVFASRYVATRMAGALAATRVGRLPLGPGALESSLWIERR
jgi:hypothetical protein